VTKPTDIASQAKRLAQKGQTPEQLERRRVVEERNKRMQERGVVRGPNAHPDGTFGKVKS